MKEDKDKPQPKTAQDVDPKSAEGGGPQPPQDQEIEAIRSVCLALEPLDEEERERVIGYVGKRYSIDCVG